MAISFYVEGEEFGEFSNFSAHGVEFEGCWYPTVEHYFQAMKFLDLDYPETIRCAVSPKSAKELGNSRDVPLRDDWEALKIPVMRAAIRQKVATHSAVAQLLLSTGDEELIEAAPHDYFWGCGKTGSGQNWLGKVLMEVRKELRRRIDS